MALSFTRLSWWWLGGKEKEQVSSGSSINSINSLGDWGLGFRGEPESLKFYSVKGVDRRMPSSSSNRKSKRKWKSREERSRRIDKEYDVVLVPSDGVCLSGSESDASDWSIGWLEPHAPDFRSDDEADDSFAVLVPCYRNDCNALAVKEEPSIQFLSAVKNLPYDYSAAPFPLPFHQLKLGMPMETDDICNLFFLQKARSAWNSGFPLSRIFEELCHADVLHLYQCSSIFNHQFIYLKMSKVEDMVGSQGDSVEAEVELSCKVYPEQINHLNFVSMGIERYIAQ